MGRADSNVETTTMSSDIIGGVYISPEIRGRLSADDIRDITQSQSDISLQVTADNGPLAITYGQSPVEGRIFAVGAISGDLVIGVAWGYGEIEEVSGVVINGESPATSVTVTDYVGSILQTNDATLAAAISGWDNPMVLQTPQGPIGVAYSVFRIPSGVLTGAPSFSAVVKGLKVNDSRPANDPLYSDVDLWVIFDKAAPFDRSSPAKTVALGSGVEVEDDFVLNSETNQGVTFSGSFAFGTQDFCIEAKVKIIDPFTTGVFDIYRGNYTSGTESILMRVNGDQIEIVIRNGATVVINETAAATIPSSSTEFDIKLIRDTAVFYLYLNGEQVWTDSTAATISTTTSQNRTCYSTSSPPRLGGVRNLRVTVGDPRYTADHDWRGLPFSDCRRYSDNSSLCFADLATNPIYGMGAVTRGIEDAANWNDDLLPSSVARARLSYSFSTTTKTQLILDLLATYAEIFWFWDGNEVNITADSAVTLATVYEETNCIANSLNISGLPESDSPNKINVRYTTPLIAPVWPTAIVSRSLPGVEEGEITPIESTLDLIGVFRAEEAENKAISRLYQMQNRVRVSWITTDKGILHQKGDVVRINIAGRGADLYVRVLSADVVSYGRYLITGLRYDPQQYSSQIGPGTTGNVPVGAILPLFGDTVPDGWEVWSAANGRFLIAAGSTYASGDTGGSSSFAGFAGVTSTDDSHSITDYNSFNYIASFPGITFPQNLQPSDPPDTSHNHTYSTGSITPDVYRREQRFVKKIGSPTGEIDSRLLVFGVSDIELAGLARVVSSANRALMAAAGNANRGSASIFSVGSTGTADDSHVHALVTVGADSREGPDTVYSVLETGGGVHSHGYTAEISLNLKRVNVPLWGNVENYPVVRGMMFLWENTASIPSGYRLCNGSFGTPDLRDHFIYISGVGSEFDKSGDNTIGIDALTSTVSHEHQGTTTVQPLLMDEFDHSNSISHRHTISGSGSWMPPYYAVGVIMFAP